VNKKLLLIPIIIFLLSVNIVLAAPVYYVDSPGVVPDTNSAGDDDYYGWKMFVNQSNLFLDNTTKAVGDTSTKAYLYYENHTLIDSYLFVGDVATIDYLLPASQTYFLMAGADGVPRNVRYVLGNSDNISGTGILVSWTNTKINPPSTWQEQTGAGASIISINGHIGNVTTNFTIQVNDIWNGNPVNNISVVIEGVGTFTNETGTVVTTTLLSNASSLYNISVSSENYVSKWYNNTNISSLLAASLFPINSLEIYVKDAETNLNLSSFNVTVQNAVYSYSNITTSNLSRFKNIVPGIYNVRIDAINYTTASYVVTVSNYSHQYLTAHLENLSSTFNFITKDKSTNGLLEGVVVSQKRFINGSLTTISSKSSDVTGRIQFNYDSGVEYTFSTSLNNYIDKDFILTILYTEYTVLLEPSEGSNSDIYFDDVVVIYNSYNLIPGSLNASLLSWVAMDFSSGYGSLEDYGFNVTLTNGSVYSGSAVSVTGSTVNVSFNDSVVVFGDAATINYYYKSTFNDDLKYGSRAVMFDTWTVASSGSLEQFKDEMSLESDFTKGFWASIVILFVTALFTFFGLLAGDPLLLGAVGGIIGSLIVASIDLINWASFGLVAFILVIIIIGKVINNS